jgi:hypothetical protein
METGMKRWLMVCLLVWMGWSTAWAQENKNLAPGFSQRAASSKIVILPTDIELFSISGGGVLEPKADWTEQATRFFSKALLTHKGQMGDVLGGFKEADVENFDELNALHGAVAGSIHRHHMFGGVLALPTKNGVLNWSMGDAVKPLREKTGADYALFTWVRDSYASSERKAAIVLMAMVGVGLVGGIQTGYASLVDLRDGRILWFNSLVRGTGDLREEQAAVDTVDALLKNFPALASK